MPSTTENKDLPPVALLRCSNAEVTRMPLDGTLPVQLFYALPRRCIGDGFAYPTPGCGTTKEG